MIAEVPDSQISRNELLTWINDTLKINLQRVEQLGSGAVHCQLLDIVYPNKIPLHKVNWRAKFEYEFVYNFKILQQSFTKFNIPKYIDVERLIKAKYQDNFEFALWMRRFVVANVPAFKEYDAFARRGNIEIDFSFNEKASVKPSVSKESLAKGQGLMSKPKSILAPRQPGLKNDSMYSQRSSENGSTHGGSTSNLFSNLPAGESKVLMDLHNMIERQKADKNPQLEILRAERDFYYSKLRDIDHILDVYNPSNNVENLINNIREILYLTPEKIAIVCEDGDIKIRNKADDGEGKENEDEMMGENKEYEEVKNVQQRGNDVMVIEEDISLEEIPRGMIDGVQGQMTQV